MVSSELDEQERAPRRRERVLLLPIWGAGKQNSPSVVKNDRCRRDDLIVARRAEAELLLCEVGGEGHDSRILDSAQSTLLEGCTNASSRIRIIPGANKGVNRLDGRVGEELSEDLSAERASCAGEDDGGEGGSS